MPCACCLMVGWRCAVFFLSDEERRFVLRKLLPESRRRDIHPELRGWSWSEPPMAPVYEAPLGVAEVAGRYCGSGRDLYLRRVAGVRVDPSLPMLEGRLLHEAVGDQLQRAIRVLYTTPVEAALKALESIRSPGVEPRDLALLPEPARGAVLEKSAALVGFEYHRIVTRVADVLARQPRVGQSGLVALALPVTVELPLDGRFLGLSSHLSVDAVSLFEPMVVDLKFGSRRDFHRLATTGYALVMESLHEFPINLGCITYCQVEKGRVRLERDFHLIDEELRQWFLELRDEMMRVVSEGIDPGRASECGVTCPYRSHCGGDG